MVKLLVGPEIIVIHPQSLPFIVDDARTRNARLALIAAAQQVIQNALGLLGVSAPEAM